MSGYAHPEVLVETQWVAENLNADGIRLVEVDVDTTSYNQGHVPGAVGWSWKTQLCDTIRRDIVSKLSTTANTGSTMTAARTTMMITGLRRAHSSTSVDAADLMLSAPFTRHTKTGDPG